MFMRRPLALAISALMFGSAMLLTACNESSTNKGSTLTPTAISFSETPAPTTADKIAVTHTSSIATVTFNDGSTKDYPLTYNKLFGVKDKVGTNPYPAGQVFNSKMQPVNDSSGKPAVIETPDANSLLNIDGKLYMVTHYEYDWLNGDGSNTTSRMPMSMTLTNVTQDTSTGKLTATDQKPINFSNVGGLWIPCAGGPTPWNTHLGGEEDYDLQYNPNSSSYSSATLGGVGVMRDIYGNVNASPYQYGHVTEVVVGKDGSATPTKHYGMGRATFELGRVMPDGKTVYFGDDGTNTALFMFVSNTVNDLSKGGTLYSAKWTQTSVVGSDGGTADLTWVKLGSSTSDTQIKALADTNTFESIFNNGTFSAGTCSSGTWIRAGSTNDECLSIKSGQETAAAFLESRRMAALKGATTEFNKMEGVTVNNKDKKLYLAMSYIDKGMLANTSAPTDHIKLVKNNAGATYTLDLIGGVKDTEGNNINSDYVAKNMYVEPALLGKDIALDSLGNTADPTKIANTDNLFFAEKMRTLFIGEDSSEGHVNNFVWAYNVDTKKLTRILSTPVGAESTGLQVLEDLNGYAYIMSNTQHHGDWKSTKNPEVDAALAKIDKFDANVGYIGGLPALK